MKPLTPANLFCLAIYLVLLAGVVVGLHRLRSWAVDYFPGADAQRDWDQWREETSRQAQREGPVFRQPVRSLEPPTLVLLRDYYGMCLAAALLFGTLFYLTMVTMIRGVLRSGPSPPYDDGQPPATREES